MVSINKSDKVIIIILCNNSKRWLNKCMDSVMNTDYDNFEVVLIDNASTDGAIDGLDDKYNNLKIIHNADNVGWCKGNNQGIQYALSRNASYVYLSNSDIIFFSSNWLTELLDFVHYNKEYKIVGPLQYEYEDKTKLNEWSKYILANGNRDVHYMWSKYITSESKSYNYDLSKENTKILNVSFVQGAAMLIDVEVFQQIGCFDELYFMFFDELDFCRRNLRIGNKVALVPTSKVQHYGSGDNSASKEKRYKRNYYFSRNKYYFLLSDYSMSSKIKKDIVKNWIFHDLKQSIHKDTDISNIGQLLHIYYDVICNYRKLILKRDLEKKIEEEKVKEKLCSYITEIIPTFTMEKFDNNLKEDFGLDFDGAMTLCSRIEEVFGIELTKKFNIESIYSPLCVLNYIMAYELWKRKI